MKRLLPLPCTLVLAGLVLPGRPSAADAVDDFVNAWRERHKIPAISVALVRDGQLVKAAGYGLANVELDVPARPETIYQSGSVGKQFTAMAVMLLVEEGKIGLDDPLTKYFTGAPGRWKDITVRHLLTHTSGIKDWEGGKDLDYRKDYTEAQLAQIAMKLPPDFSPGTQWSYSNTGYALLGIIVGKASGRFYGDFLKERVFAPLGMDATRIISEKDIVKNRAAGYSLEKDELKNQEWVSPALNTTADGSLYFTVLDVAKWDAALGAGKLLKPESYAAMWSPVRLADGTSYPYGFGWALRRAAGREGDRARRVLAGVPHRHHALRGHEAHRDRPRQPGPGRAREHGHRHRPVSWSRRSPCPTPGHAADPDPPPPPPCAGARGLGQGAPFSPHGEGAAGHACGHRAREIGARAGGEAAREGKGASSTSPPTTSRAGTSSAGARP